MTKMDDIGFVIRKKYGEKHLVVYNKLAPGLKAQLARELIIRYGLIAGKPDGEDDAGRQKLALFPPDELVERACEIAERFVNAVKERDWYLKLDDSPAQDE